MKTSSFSRHDLQHMCKLSFDGNLIFYENCDFLVFITIVFAYAARYKIRITGLCVMFNHFHILCYPPNEKSLDLFYQQVCAVFVKYYNRRSGKIKIRLKPGPNISSKYGDKQKRTAYLYLANNPVDKKFCVSPSEYAWCFFENVEYVQTCAESAQLTLAKAIVRDSHKAQKPLTYEFFQHFDEVLKPDERKDLKNYILSIYVDIDSSDVKRLFGSVDAFLHFSENIIGADYQSDDDLTKEDYKHYSTLARLLRRRGLWGNDAAIHEGGFDREEMIQFFASHTNSSNVEISRFVHLPLEEVKDITGRGF